MTILLTALLTLPYLLHTYAQNDQTLHISIYNKQDYATARPCIQRCIYYGGNDDLGGRIGCGGNPINGCYCSSRLASIASSYLTSCIGNFCSVVSDPADLSSAVSLYDGYCATANAVTSARSSGASDATSRGSSPLATSHTTGPVPSSANPTSAVSGSIPTNEGSAAELGSEGGLSTASKIALGVGLGAGIPILALLGAIFYILVKKGKQSGDTNFGGIEDIPKAL